jgi:transposase
MTTIIGLDLGKYNSVACTFFPGDGEVRFAKLPTTAMHLRQLFERERPDLVVIEACSQAGWVAQLCREMGVKVMVANTNGEAWKWKNVKRKTDRDDALKLALMAHRGDLPTSEVRERRALMNFRQLLVTQRVQLQNHLRAVLVAQGITAPVGHRAWTEAGMAFWNELARSLGPCTSAELWRGQLHVAVGTVPLAHRANRGGGSEARRNGSA